MCGGGKGSSGGFGGLAPAQQQTVQASPEAIGWYQQSMARAQQAASQPYQQFGTTPQQFVAQLTPTQQNAIQNISGTQGMAQPYYQAATGVTANALNPAYNTVGNYMNPFMGQVVNPVQQAVRQQQGQQLAQQQAEAIRGGAFGGERAGLQRAQLMGQQNLGLGQALSPLYQTGYGQALQAAQQQQQYGLQGAQQLGNIGAAAQQAALGQAQAQLGAGTLEQQTQQAGINALYNQFQQQQMFPYMQAQFLSGIAGGLGPLMGQQTFQSQAQSPFGMFLSDPRAKMGVGRGEPDVVGELYDGQKVHAYKYKDGGPAQIGLMADEVADYHPEAVGVRPDGLMAVDYGAATEDAARLGKGLGMARMGGAVREEGDYARGGYADGGLTAGDIASIVAAHQAMYGQMPKAQTNIPTEGIKTGTPLTPGHMTPPQKEASGLSSALAAGEGITDMLTKGADLYSWYKGEKGPTALAKGKAYGGVAGYAEGGEAPNEDDDLWKGLTGGIRAAQGLRAADLNTPGADKDPSRQRSFLDTASDAVGTAGKLGGLASGLYSAATTLGPALMAMSDPRMKTGVGRSGYEEGGPTRRYTDEDIAAYLRPLAKGESGGEKDPYAALGPVTKSGDRAYGKYQIMGANIPRWSKEAGLGPLTAEEFLANKEAQEKIAQHRFGQYLEQTGAPEEAAAMWFAGPGYKKHMGARDVLGTSIPEYQARYRRNLDRGLGEEIASLGPKERSFQASANLPPEGTTVDLKKGVGAAPPADTDSLEDKLLSRQTIIPALTGLGSAITAMTSSPSRYLGTAIAQGLGAGLTAGAKSYMDTGLQIPEIDKRTQEALKEAQEVKIKQQLLKKFGFETVEEMMKAYQSAFYTTQAGVPMVRLADGTTVSEAEWRRNPRPVFGQETQAAGTPGTQKPITSTQPVVAPPGIVFDNRSTSTARNEMDSVYGSDKQAAIDVHKRSSDYRDTVDKAAEAAQAQKLLINDVGGIVAEMTHATGMNAPGAGGSTRAMIVNYGNTIARAAGYGENYFGASDTADQLLNKINTLAGQRGVEAAQQTSLGSLSQLIKAQPDLNQTPYASTFNAASNMVNNQMKVDQRDHADTYGQASGNLYSRAGVDFKRTNSTAKYRKETDALQKAMWNDPQGFAVMVSGQLKPEDIEQYFRDPKHGGIVGMSRYFGG